MEEIRASVTLALSFLSLIAATAGRTRRKISTASILRQASSISSARMVTASSFSICSPPDNFSIISSRSLSSVSFLFIFSSRSFFLTNSCIKLSNSSILVPKSSPLGALSTMTSCASFAVGSASGAFSAGAASSTAAVVAAIFSISSLEASLVAAPKTFNNSFVNLPMISPPFTGLSSFIATS